MQSVSDGMVQLIANVACLRAPVDGCIWFRQQTFRTLRRYLLEEVYEALDALDSEAPEKLQEELGDLLFQIIAISQLASEHSWFSLDDILHRINDKIIYRNPHVFEGMQADTVEDVQRIWMERKALEKTALKGIEAFPLDGLSASMPALALAQAYVVRGGDVKIDDAFQNQTLLNEILQDSVFSHPEAESRLGVLLFTIAGLAQHHHLDSEAALQKINAQIRGKAYELFSKSPEETQG